MFDYETAANIVKSKSIKVDDKVILFVHLLNKGIFEGFHNSI
jgi:hypothetical protein